MSHQENITSSPRGRTQGCWDNEYGLPTMEKHCDQRNMHRRESDADLIGEHQPCNIQTMPYTLFISGVHPQSTEDEIIHILQYYGNLNSVHFKRNQFNETVAFAEFVSQREANSAIINLNGKSPLFWSVSYVRGENMRGENSLDHSSELVEVIFQELGRHTPLRTAAVMKRTATPTYPGRVVRESLYEFPPCTVCATPTKLVCFVCKIPYCSDFCESVGWPTHRNSCIRPPALEYAPPQKRTPIKGSRDSPNLSPSQNCCDRNAESLVNPKPSIVQGIRTLGIDDGPSSSPWDQQPIALNQEPARVSTDASPIPRTPMSAVALLHAALNRSIVTLLKPGDAVALAITTDWEESNGGAGYLIRPTELDDAKALDYDMVVAGVGDPVPVFNVAVGSLISALSPEYGQWFRGCIMEATSTSYTVLYIDFGIREEGIVSVKPIPADYEEIELGVKLSFGSSNISADVKKYARQHFIPYDKLDLKIVCVESDGSVLGTLKSPGAPDFCIKLEPWTALLQEKKSQMFPLVQQQLSPPSGIKCPPLEAGFSGDVVIHVIEGVDCIFAQSVSDEDSLTEMDLILMDLFQKSTEPETVISVGTYVASYCIEEGEFYRARVTAVDGTQLTLEYIDYEDTAAQVQLFEVRTLSNELHKKLNLVLQSTEGFGESMLSKHGQAINDVISNMRGPPPLQYAPVQIVRPMPKLVIVSPDE